MVVQTKVERVLKLSAHWWFDESLELGAFSHAKLELRKRGALDILGRNTKADEQVNDIAE